MTQETPTEVAVPTPAETAEAPKTEAVETPAEETKPEAEVTETKPEAIPWGDKTDFRDVLDMDEAQPFLQRRDQRREGEMRRGFQAQYDEEVGNWKSSEAHKQLAGIYGNMLQKIEEGDTVGQEKLIDRLETAIEPYKESYIKGKQDEGARKAASELFQAVVGSLDRRGQEDFQDYLVANRGAGWGDILAKRDEIREGKSKESTKDKITSLEAQIEDLKAKARPEGPDTTPKGGGGSGDDSKKLLDPNTPVSELIEIRARQKAVGG